MGTFSSSGPIFSAKTLSQAFCTKKGPSSVGDGRVDALPRRQREAFTFPSSESWPFCLSEKKRLDPENRIGHMRNAEMAKRDEIFSASPISKKF